MSTVTENIDFKMSGLDIFQKAGTNVSLLAKSLDSAAEASVSVTQATGNVVRAFADEAKAAIAAAEAKKAAAKEAREAGKEYSNFERELLKAFAQLNASSAALNEHVVALGKEKEAAEMAAVAEKEMGAAEEKVAAVSGEAAGEERTAAEATAELGDAANGAAPKVRTLTDQMSDIRNAAAVAQAALGALKNSVAMFAPVMEDAVRLKNLSQATGESVHSLVVLEQAMKNTGAQGERAGAVFSRLARVVEDARPGTATENAFKKLGISISEFAGQAPIERLRTLQEAFAKIEDRSRRTAVAMQLFGAQGQAMLPLLLNVNVLAEAEKQVGRYAAGMQKHAADFAEIKKQIDALTNAVSAGFVEALHTLAPLIKGITVLIQNIPIKFFAAAIVATSAAMAVGAVAAIVKVTMSLREQAQSWFSTARATDGATAALSRHTVAATAAMAANQKLAASNVAAGASNLAGGLGMAGKIGGVTKAGGGLGVLGKFGKGAGGFGLGMGLSIGGGMLGEALSNNGHETSGNILGSAATGAGIGMMLGPKGALVGGAIGALWGVGQEGYKNFEETGNPLLGLTQAERDAAKAAREMEENTRRQTKAFEDARDPIARIEGALQAWANTQAESRAELMRSTGAEVMGISAEMGFGGMSDAGELLGEIRKRKMELEAVVEKGAGSRKGAEAAEAASKELQDISDKIHAIEALAGRQKALREQEKSGALAVFKSQQAVELEELETSLKKKQIKEEAYLERRKAMLRELHLREADFDTADDAEVNENRRKAEMLRLERELTHEGKSEAGRRNLDFRPSDASVRVGLNVGAVADGSVSYQRGILDESKKMRVTMEQLRDKVDFGRRTSTWSN